MKSILTILLSVLCLSMSAQEKKRDNKMDNYMPMMTRGIGVSFQKFEGLNSRIAQFPQYKPLKDHMWSISAGSMHVKNNFISQLAINAGSSLSGDRDKKSSALRFIGAGLDLGYDFIPDARLMLYPLAGVGVETYHAIFYKDNSGVNFDDVAEFPVVQNNIRSVKFVNTFFTYHFGLGFALKSPKSGGSIGIQAGYTGSFKDKAWKSAEYQSLNNAPSDNLSRFAVSLVFTGGMNMMK